VWFNFSKVKGSVTGRERRGKKRGGGGEREGKKGGGRGEKKKSPTKPNEL